jgi:hypothetical protein
MKRPSGQLVEASLGNLRDGSERGPMSVVDRRQRLVVRDAIRARLLGVGMGRRLLGRRHTSLALFACRRDASGGGFGGHSNEILKPLLDCEQLTQPLVSRFVDVGSRHLGARMSFRAEV